MEKTIYTSNEKGTGHKRLSSYHQAAELICACWNQLDARISFDFLVCPLVHRIQIEDGLIIKMNV